VQNSSYAGYVDQSLDFQSISHFQHSSSSYPKILLSRPCRTRATLVMLTVCSSIWNDSLALHGAYAISFCIERLNLEKGKNAFKFHNRLCSVCVTFCVCIGHIGIIKTQIICCHCGGRHTKCEPILGECFSNPVKK